jgi:hypothetical protein
MCITIFLLIISLASSSLPQNACREQGSDGMEMLDKMQFSLSNLKSSFVTLRKIYCDFNRQKNTNDVEISAWNFKFSAAFTRYRTVVENFYKQSPMECLRHFRFCASFEYSYFFTSLIVQPCAENFYKTFSYYGNSTAAWKNLKSNLLNNYSLIIGDILHRPFKSPEKLISEEGTKESIEVKEVDFDAAADWEERKEILKELILGLKSLRNMALAQGNSGFHKEVCGKIAKIEYLIRNFQVEKKGPSHNHFLMIFHDLQRLNEEEEYISDEFPQKTKFLLTIFKLYSAHLSNHQLSDPSLFPKSMLGMSCRHFRDDIFNLSKSLPQEVWQSTISFLQKSQILWIYRKYKRFLPVNDIGPGIGLLYNILNLGEDILNPQDEWIIRVYLAFF